MTPASKRAQTLLQNGKKAIITGASPAMYSSPRPASSPLHPINTLNASASASGWQSAPNRVQGKSPLDPSARLPHERSYNRPKVTSLAADNNNSSFDDTKYSSPSYSVSHYSSSTEIFNRPQLPMTSSNNNKQSTLSSYYSPSNLPIGLSNVGNTCFMNSVLQCLLNLPVFRKKLNDENLLALLRSDEPLIFYRELIKLTRHLESKELVDRQELRDLKTALAQHSAVFLGYEQQDAHEFLIAVLSVLSDELSSSLRRQYAPVQTLTDQIAQLKHQQTANNQQLPETDQQKLKQLIQQESDLLQALLPTECVFQSEIVQVLECSVCHAKRSRLEYFHHLSLDLPVVAPNTNGSSVASISNALEQDAQSLLSDYFSLPHTVDFKCSVKDCTGTSALQTPKLQALPKVLVCHLKRFNYIQIARKPRVSDAKSSAATKTSPENSHESQPDIAPISMFDDEAEHDPTDPFAFEGQPQVRPLSQRLHEPQSGREVSTGMSTNAYFKAVAPKLRGGAKPAIDDSDSDGPCSRPKGYAQKLSAAKSNKAASSAGTGKPAQKPAAATSPSEVADLEINDQEAEALLMMDLKSATKFLGNLQSKGDSGVKSSDQNVRHVNPVSPAVVPQKTSTFLSPTIARSHIVDDDDDFVLPPLKSAPVQSNTEAAEGSSSTSTAANNNEIEFHYTKSQARVRLTSQIDLLPFCSAQRLNLSPTPAQSCSVMTSPRGKGGSRNRSDDESDESQRPKRQKPSPHQVDLTDDIEEQSPIRHRIPTLTHVPESPDNSQGMSSQNNGSAIAAVAAHGSAWLSTNGKYSSPPPVAPASTTSLSAASKTTIPLSPVASRPKPISSPIKRSDKSHLTVDLNVAPMEFVKKFIMYYRQPIGAFLTEQNGPNRNQRRARVVDHSDPSSVILDHVEKQHDWEMVRGSDAELRALAMALQSMLEMYFAVSAADVAMEDELELTDDTKPVPRPQSVPKAKPDSKSITDRLFLKKTESSVASTHRKLELMPVPLEKPAEKPIAKAPSTSSSEKGEKVNAFAPSAAARNTTVRRNTRTAQEEEEAELQEAMRLSLLEEQSRKSERTARDNNIDSVRLVELGCTTYTLHAVVHHKGRSAVRGHYIATVRDSGDQKSGMDNLIDFKWHEFDDSIVSEQTDAEARDGTAKETAYILFYIRDDVVADASKSK